MKKRFLSIIICLVLCLSLLPATALAYTVDFDANGGGGNMESVTADAGSEYRLPPNEFDAPEPENQQFQEWALNSPDGVRYQVGDIYTVDADTIFYAVWENYDLYVGGEQVTSQKLSGNGWSYDPTENTLTLNNYSNEGDGYEWDNTDSAAIYYIGADTLVIKLEGESSLTNTAEESGYGVYTRGGLTISGGTLSIATEGVNSYGICAETGSVTIENTGEVTIETAGHWSRGIYAETGSVTIAGKADVTTRGDGSDGIYAETDSVTISGTVDIITEGDGSCGIYAYNDVTIDSDGAVTITTGGEDSDGICANGRVTISGAVSITATGRESYGIITYDGDVTISGAVSITATGKLSHGICANAGSVTIGGEAEITTGEQHSYGIITYDGDVTIDSNGAVSITTEGDWSDGICAEAGSVTITGEAAITTMGQLSYGIYTCDGSVTIGGEVAITTAGDYSDGIYASDGSVTIGGEVAITTAGESSCGIYTDSENLQGRVTIDGDVKIAAPGGKAFNRKPVVDNGARVWYGDSEDEAEFAFAGELVDGYHQNSYVRIAPWPRALYVQGEQVTSANAADVLGDGTVSFDPAADTLILTDAVIDNPSGEGIVATGDLTIKGTGTVTGITYGVCVRGTLTVEKGSHITATGTENCALAAGDGFIMIGEIVTLPENPVSGTVDVEDGMYTTYGTETGAGEFTPAKTVRFEPAYQVWFDAGEGVEYQEVVAGGKAERPDDPTQSGYTFGGWYTDEACTQAYDFDAEVTEDLWLYAKWTVNFSGDDSDDSDDSDDNDDTPGTPAVDQPATGNSGGWTEIRKELEDLVKEMETGGAAPGATVSVDMNGATVVPAEALEEIAGKDINVEFDMGGGVSWTVNGRDIPAGIGDLNLGISADGGSIPVNVFNMITGEKSAVQLELTHEGPFGTTLHLSVELGEENHGYWANLYYYDEAKKELQFQHADRIDEMGRASWPFDHASSYAIVIDDENHDPDRASPFTDVAKDAYYYEAVLWAVRNGVTNGTGDGTTFSPDAPCTRAQMVTFLWRAAGTPEPADSASPFTDVAADKYYAKAVQWAYEQGITSGTGDGTTFSPDAPCTRAQMVTFLYRSLAE